MTQQLDEIEYKYIVFIVQDLPCYFLLKIPEECQFSQQRKYLNIYSLQCLFEKRSIECVFKII